MQGGDVDNKKVSDSADQALHRFVSVLAEIEHKEEVQDEDILRLTDLLNDYAKHPGSTEESRIYASKELDRVNAIYMSKNKS
jgi:hypothetical protein